MSEASSGKSRTVIQELGFPFMVQASVYLFVTLCPSQRGKRSMAMETICAFSGAVYESFT